MIEKNMEDEVLVLRFAHGKASALDTEFLREIASEIAAYEASDARACILTGTGRIFSAGVDLKQLVEGGDAYLDEFLPALEDTFHALFFCEKPIVAACNGHAIAGGGIILSCCDVRIGACGRGRIGVPELSVGVPFPPLALEIMRFVTPAHHLQTTLYSGDTYDMDAALARGLLDSLSEAEELDDHALAVARKLGSYPGEAFASTKRMLRRPVADRLAAHAEADRARIRELWGSAEVRAAIEDYVAKTLG